MALLSIILLTVVYFITPCAYRVIGTVYVCMYVCPPQHCDIAGLVVTVLPGLLFQHPAHEVQLMAREIGVEVRTVALGVEDDSRLTEISQTLMDCCVSGCWLILQNVHLTGQRLWTGRLLGLIQVCHPLATANPLTGETGRLLGLLQVCHSLATADPLTGERC